MLTLTSVKDEFQDWQHETWQENERRAGRTFAQDMDDALGELLDRFLWLCSQSVAPFTLTDIEDLLEVARAETCWHLSGRLDQADVNAQRALETLWLTRLDTWQAELLRRVSARLEAQQAVGVER